MTYFLLWNTESILNYCFFFFFFVHTKKSSQRDPRTQQLFRILSFLFHNRKKIIQPWNDMKVNELSVIRIYPQISRPTFQALHAPLDVRYPFPAVMPGPFVISSSDKPRNSVYLTYRSSYH